MCWYVFKGDEWFVDDLKLAVLNDWREWFALNSTQVAGWTKDFERIHMVTVRGSGHMVPQWRPKAALQMFTNFLKNQQL